MGIALHVVTLLSPFLFIGKYKKILVDKVSSIPVNLIIRYHFVGAVLIIFEEHVNCQPHWCGKVFIPPTLPFTLFELFVLFIICTRLKNFNVKKVLGLFCIYGIFFEYIFGGLRGPFQMSPLLFFMTCWVAVSYAFIAYLPLCIFEKRRGVK